MQLIQLLTMANKPGLLSSKAWLTVLYGFFLLNVDCDPELKAYLGSGAFALFLVVKTLEDGDERRNPGHTTEENRILRLELVEARDKIGALKKLIAPAPDPTV